MTSVIKNQPISSFPDKTFDANAFIEASQFHDPSQLLKLLEHQQGQARKKPEQTRITIDEAKEQIQEYLEGIWDKRDGLQFALSRFELQIRKKWKKMTFAKREAAVKSVWPRCAARRDAGIYYYSMKHIKTIDEDSLVLPYLNVEDLCRDPSHLTGLFYHRSRILPGKFAQFDLEEASMMKRPLIQKSAKQPVFVKCYGDRHSYGNLVETLETEPTGDVLSIEDALILLQAQSDLFYFLSELATIIAPKPAEASDPTEIELVPAPELMTTICRQKNPSKDWISTAEANLVRPFASPPQFSMAKLQEIANAKRNEAQDRIWILRRDPIYMHQELKAYDDHRIERILGSDGHRHPEVEKPIFYDRIIAKMVNDCNYNVVAYDLIDKEIGRLEKAYDAELTNIEPEKALPKDLNEAFGALETLLESILTRKFESLPTMVMASPALRDMFDRKPHPSLKSGSVDMLFDYDKTIWLLLSLAESTSPIQCSRIIDELDQFLLDNQQESLRISPFLLERIAEVASLVEMLIILGYLRPKYQPLADQEKSILLNGRWRPLYLVDSLESFRFGKYITPYNRFLQTGLKKDHGKKNHADEALKQLWRVIDEHVEAGAETNLSILLETCLVMKEDSVTSISRKSHKPRQKSVHFPDKLSTILEIKHKPITITNPDALPTPTLKIRPPEPVFQVAERHYKTLCKLFPLSTEEDRDIGQIEWKDFVACMIALGFRVEKKRGSDWYFVKKDELHKQQADKVIVVPEEEKKMSVTGMRVLEKRLMRRFMWSRAVFEVADKTSA